MRRFLAYVCTGTMSRGLGMLKSETFELHSQFLLAADDRDDEDDVFLSGCVGGGSGGEDDGAD